MRHSREILGGPTLDAARALIGAELVRESPDGDPGRRRVGRIVEVEAYIGEEDAASHARFGRTARSAVMFGPPGIAYVYLVYGMYDCLNVVTEAAGSPAAVLIRAVEPTAGGTQMRGARLAHARRVRRSWTEERFAAERDRAECRARQSLAIGAMADHDLRWIDLGLVGDAAAMATSVDLHS